MASMLAASGDGPDTAIASCGERLGALGLERSEEEIREMFERWMVQKDRNYDSLAEKDRRFQIFKEKFLYIERHNAAADAGIHSHRLGLNRFSDLTLEEFRDTFLCPIIPQEPAIPRRRRRLEAGDGEAGEARLST